MINNDKVYDDVRDIQVAHDAKIIGIKDLGVHTYNGNTMHGFMYRIVTSPNGRGDFKLMMEAIEPNDIKKMSLRKQLKREIVKHVISVDVIYGTIGSSPFGNYYMIGKLAKAKH